jgi:hypothetical protein
MIAVIRTELVDVEARLAELGLAEGIFHKAIFQGLLARSETTLNHPPLYAGFVTWGNVVRGVRDELGTQQWERDDENNYSRVFNPSRTMAIAIATGDENTGNSNGTPMTKSPKGSATNQAVESNAAQLSFEGEGFDRADWPSEDGVDAKTWLLLFCIAKNEVRCELSLPITCNGKVDGWMERIILRPIQLDPISAGLPIPTLPDIEVPISRRA